MPLTAKKSALINNFVEKKGWLSIEIFQGSFALKNISLTEIRDSVK